ncbi:MAG: hypothetical protein AB1765_05885 [Candidatus Hydrogenedentota bacterium]
MKDIIVEEVRKNRLEISKKFNFSIKEYCEYLRGKAHTYKNIYIKKSNGKKKIAIAV